MCKDIVCVMGLKGMFVYFLDLEKNKLVLYYVWVEGMGECNVE